MTHPLIEEGQKNDITFPEFVISTLDGTTLLTWALDRNYSSFEMASGIWQSHQATDQSYQSYQKKNKLRQHVAVVTATFCASVYNLLGLSAVFDPCRPSGV